MLRVWRPSKLSRQQLEERRLHGQELLEAGHSTTEITRALGIPASTLRNWRQKLRVHGQDALRATIGGGRPARLGEEQRQQLREMLHQGAKAHQYEDDTWTTLRVRELIGKTWGVWYHRDHVGDLLKSMGFSYQKPETRALERDEKRIRTWVDTTLPGLGEKN